MRITFCDLCDESIPLADLERGQAVRRGPRAICARCERALGDDEAARGAAGERVPEGVSEPLPPPALRRAERLDLPAGDALRGSPFAPAPAPSSGPALVLGVLALCFALASSLYLLSRIDRAGRDLASARSGWQEELARVVAGLSERVDARAAEASERALAALSEAQALALRLDDGLAARDQALEHVQAELAALAALPQRAEAASTSPPDAAGDGALSGEDFARLEREVAELRSELGRLGAQPESGGPATARDAALVAPAVERPAWWSLVPGLQSRNASERWTAVQALGQTREPAVAEHVVPLLKDPDLFVRMASCRALGELRAVRAIPALIDALEDAEPSVREEAVVALRAISGQDLRFDANAAAGERAKRVEAWRAWWTEAKDGLLGG